MSFLLSLFIGYLIADLYLDRERRLGWMAVWAAPGLGFAVSSGILFFDLLFFDSLNAKFLLADHCLIFILLLLAAFRLRRPDRPLPNKIIYTALIVLTLLAVAAVFFKAPNGTGLDAWAIWKLKARHIFYGQTPLDSLRVAPLNFSHPDYPLFYPLILAWSWLWGGGEGWLSSWLLCAVFTVALIGSVAWVVLYHGRRLMAMAAGLLLISTPHLMGVAGSQYADIFTAYFNTMAVVLFITAKDDDGRFGGVFWCGVFLGIGVFVKNEGWLSFAAMGMACVLMKREALRPLVSGALPGLIVCLLFKFRMNIPTTSVHPEGLTQAWEYLRFLGKEILHENKWVYAWLFLFATLIFNRTKDKNLNVLFLWFLFVNVGYALVHLTDGCTGEVFRHHLSTSVDRLLIHTFPAAAVVAFAVIFRSPDRIEVNS